MGIIRATTFAPIRTDIRYMITIIIIRVGTLATLAPKCIVIGTTFTVNTDTLYTSTPIFIFILLTSVAIDTTVRA
jgi:hypothetical protein